jgi:hypothetical protein
MKPECPDILTRVLAIAEKTLDRPTGHHRRRDEIEKLFEEVAAAKEWPTDRPPRVVNEWTELLVKMLRKIEAIGPYGDQHDVTRAAVVAKTLVELVQRDLLSALQIAARPTA